MNFKKVHFLAFHFGLGTRPFPSTLKGVAYLRRTNPFHAKQAERMKLTSKPFSIRSLLCFSITLDTPMHNVHAAWTNWRTTCAASQATDHHSFTEYPSKKLEWKWWRGIVFESHARYSCCNDNHFLCSPRCRAHINTQNMHELASTLCSVVHDFN